MEKVVTIRFIPGSGIPAKYHIAEDRIIQNKIGISIADPGRTDLGISYPWHVVSSVHVSEVASD